MMNKFSLSFLLLLLATSCAIVGSTTKTASADAQQPPVYYTGKDAPAASGVFVYAEDNK
jgi:hypothetical protein